MDENAEYQFDVKTLFHYKILLKIIHQSRSFRNLMGISMKQNLKTLLPDCLSKFPSNSIERSLNSSHQILNNSRMYQFHVTDEIEFSIEGPATFDEAPIVSRIEKLSFEVDLIKSRLLSNLPDSIRSKEMEKMQNLELNLGNLKRILMK